MGIFASNTYLSDISSDSSDGEEFIKTTDKAMTIDAALNSNIISPRAEDVITIGKLSDIESKLDDYEMVSLVYLLYNDTYFALQELVMWLDGATNKQLLYEWAVREDTKMNSNWQWKLLEALCIIQNYEIVIELGYKKVDLIYNYLPHRENITVFINKFKKAIYLVCEKLSKNQTASFLSHVRNDFRRNNKDFQEFDPLLLELYFLHWETIKYINKEDVTSITKIFKVMDLEALYDILNSVVPPPSNLVTTKIQKPFKNRKTSTSIDTTCRNENLPGSSGSFLPFSRKVFEGSMSPEISMGSDTTNENPTDGGDHKYHIDPKNPGAMLIINQEVFYTEPNKAYSDLLPPSNGRYYKLESRLGTEKDRDKIKDVFEKYGFRVKVVENLMHTDMLEEIKKFVEGISKESSLFVCILSHGYTGVVYGVNSCKVKVSEIERIMCKTNIKNLTGKPKLLILQSCQGNQCQKIEEDSSEEHEIDNENTTDGVRTVSSTADMLTFWATVPGYAAIRNKRTGSWFIQALCKKIEEIGNTHHFADICTRIVNDVSSLRWIDNFDNNVMTPMVVSTFRKDFFLPPINC